MQTPTGLDPTQPGLMGLAPIDDLDSRREMIVCIEKLTIEERRAFLKWCVDLVNGRNSRHSGFWRQAVITNNSGTSRETMLDVCQLISQFGLSINETLQELERRATEARKLWLPD